jgi:O-antigen/teichoic acid export membrane protein
MLGYAIASILGIFLLFTSTPHSRSVQTDVRSALDLMLGFGRPIFLGSLATGATLRFQGFLLSWFVSDTAFGNYHVAHNFTVLIGLVTGSLAITLFPAFSRLSNILEPEKVQEALRSSIKYSSTFIVPIIFLIGAVSKPMVSTLFAGSYPQVPLLLSLLLVPTLLICLGSFSLRSFLNSQGDTKMSLKIELIGSVTNILVAPILLWIFGIFGLAYSLII